MEKDEFEQLKERTKINFLQIEKILANYDDRLDCIEKDLKDFRDFKDLKRILKTYDEKIEEVERNTREIDNLGKNIGGISENIKNIKANIRNELTNLKNKIENISQMKDIKEFEEIKANVLGINNNFNILRKEFEEIKKKVGEENIKNLREAIKEYDQKISEIEEKINLVKVGDKVAEDFNNKINEINKDLNNKINELKNKIENISQMKDIKEFDEMRDKIRNNLLKIEHILKGYQDRMEKLENQIPNIEKINKKFDEMKKEMVVLEKNIGENITALKKDLGSIKDLKEFKNKFDKIEDFVKEFDNNFEQWEVFAQDLNKNKDMYLKLREVVISAIEKMRQKEQVFDQNIEEFAIITKKLEENEKMYENLSNEIKNQILVLKEEVNKFKNNMEEISGNKIAELEKRLDDIENVVLGKIERIEKEVIPNKIDDEINKLIHILNEKLVNSVTITKFNDLKKDIENKIQAIREPKIKTIENRMTEIEKDIEEVKILIKRISQRLPVVVE